MADASPAPITPALVASSSSIAPRLCFGAALTLFLVWIAVLITLIVVSSEPPHDRRAAAFPPTKHDPTPFPQVQRRPQQQPRL